MERKWLFVECATRPRRTCPFRSHTAYLYSLNPRGICQVSILEAFAKSNAGIAVRVLIETKFVG
jgi:hypothetical protein